jgi:hypothetical protein
MGWIGTCGGSLVAAGHTRGGETIGLFPGLQEFGGATGNRTFVFDVKHPIIANSRAADRITAELEMHVRGGPSDYILNRYSALGAKNWVIARHKEGKRRPGVVAVLFGEGRVFLTTAHPERPKYLPADIAKAPQVIEIAAEWCAGLSDPPDNKPPTVILEAPTRGRTAQRLRFAGSDSDDPEGYPLGFIWDFGDGAPRSFTPSARHAFTSPGEYTVTLTVTDGESRTVRYANITIDGPGGDGPPIVRFLSPFRGNHLSGHVEISVRASDPDKGPASGDGVKKVELGLLRDGQAVLTKTLSRAPYTWKPDLTHLPDGPRQLKARALSTVEAGGTETTTSIPVTVANKEKLVQASVHAEFVRLTKAPRAGSPEANARLQALKKRHMPELMPYMGVGRGRTLEAYGQEWRVFGGTWAGDSSAGITGGSPRGQRIGRLGLAVGRGGDVALSATGRLVRGRRSQVGLWIAGTSADREDGGYLLALSDRGVELRRKGEVVQQRDDPVLRTDQDYKLRLQRVGSVVKAFVNDLAEPSIEWTDPNPLTGPEHRTLGFCVSRGMVVMTDCKVGPPK